MWVKINQCQKIFPNLPLETRRVLFTRRRLVHHLAPNHRHTKCMAIDLPARVLAVSLEDGVGLTLDQGHKIGADAAEEGAVTLDEETFRPWVAVEVFVHLNP